MTESRKATQPKFPMDAAAAKNQIESNNYKNLYN